MSFSSEVKQELAKQSGKSRHCQIAELAALVAFDGKRQQLIEDAGDVLDSENPLLQEKLQAISAADAGIFERQIKDGVSEEFLAQIKNRIRENETEAVTEHYEQIQIHQTEIANYEKKQGTCVITFQSAVGYLHYCEKAGKVLSGSKDLTEQTRYNVQLMYIQNEKLAGMDNAVGTTCPNCGAPITNLGAAYCEYCGSAVTLLNLKVWTLHSFDETDYHHS